MQYKNLKEEVVEVSVYDCYVYKCNYFTKEGSRDCLMLKSIGTYGVINPVIARYKNHNYEIILGKRRFLALKELEIPIVPLIIRDLNDAEVDLKVLDKGIIKQLKSQGSTYNKTPPLETMGGVFAYMGKLRWTRYGQGGIVLSIA